MKILIAIDASPCSQAAVQAVIRQFRPDDTKALILHVLEWPAGVQPFLSFAEGAAAAGAVLEAHNQMRGQASELVERAQQALHAAKFDAATDVREGDPRRVILECAENWHPDVIVMGSHGRSGLNRLFLGSVSEAVVRHAPCSVQVVRDDSLPQS